MDLESVNTTIPPTAAAQATAAGAAKAVTMLQIPNVPAAFFGMVLGLAGLGNAWRAATEAWRLPMAIGKH